MKEWFGVPLSKINDKHLINILRCLWDGICPKSQVLTGKPFCWKFAVRDTAEILVIINEIFDILNKRRKGGFPHRQSKDWNFVATMLKKNKLSDYDDISKLKTMTEFFAETKKSNVNHLSQKRKKQEKLMNEL